MSTLRTLCDRCQQQIPAEPFQIVLSCTPDYTAFTKRGQTTGITGYTHGLGLPPTLRYERTPLPSEAWRRGKGDCEI